MTPSFWKYLLGSNTTIISERGGHCFFIQKTDETLAKARVKKNKTQIVFTLSFSLGGKTYGYYFL